jgi:hypothetical protein
MNKRTQKKTAKRRASRRRNPEFKIPKSVDGLFSNQALLAGIGLILIGLTGGKLPNVVAGSCNCPDGPADCPKDDKGIYLNAQCFHFGHVPGLCHKCYCLKGKGDEQES